jgi:hypothetical protein
VNAVSLAGLAEDPAEVVLAPGRYRVLATRGPEYEIRETRLAPGPGEVATLAIEAPPRALETPGWIGADLHVHSAESFDASWPLERQLVAFAANGAEVLVSTEHDRVFDPRPTLSKLGLDDRLLAITGVEVTSAYAGGEVPFTIGHLNAYPMRRDPLAFRGGAPRSEGRRVRTLLAELGRGRGLPLGASANAGPAQRGNGVPFVQLNHPRGHEQHKVEDGAYFTHLAVSGRPYDPTRPLEAKANRALAEPDPTTGLRDLDYDGVELLNGPDANRFRLVRADWLSLLLQGHVHVGVGNSDTHRAGEVPGLPRTYVTLADDRIAAFDEAAFFTALRAGHAFATTGPLLDVKLGDAGPGGRFRGTKGTLRVAVAAAPWVPVDRLLVHRDGQIVVDQPIARGEGVELLLEFARDGFVVVEVEGVPDPTYRALLPGFTPLAVANPIFVDADGDGEWSAPGLPNDAPPLLRDPLRSALREEKP